MGTKLEAQELQRQLKDLCASAGWSQNKLARVLYRELYSQNDDAGARRFQERLKKALQRDSTKPERLEQYLAIAHRCQVTEKQQQHFHRPEKNGYISETMSIEMKRITAEMDMQLAQQSPRRTG
ncbi:hypothetical protein [Alteromonas lipotrueiana]|uniref:hypothetical protein n=1 Tax=Alteromonas lipotrueiana TaxID=2803815 RepID=UPI001C4493C1|nr:hypothetical protein [Alteromonas lipotrueiana]